MEVDLTFAAEEKMLFVRHEKASNREKGLENTLASDLAHAFMRFPRPGTSICSESATSPIQEIRPVH